MSDNHKNSTMLDHKTYIPELNIWLRGYSIAARFSSFFIREWNIMLDAGINTEIIPEHIFITHAHDDHILHLYQILNNNPNKSKPFVYVPYGTKKFFQQFLDARQKLSHLNQNSICRKCQIIECTPGQNIPIVTNKKNMIVNIFQTDHTTNSIAFAFSEVKNKLKSEYLSKTGQEIKKAKELGIDIYNKITNYQLVYTGDTRNTLFETNNWWKNYKVIITECTFIGELSITCKKNEDTIITQAHKKGHNYWEVLSKIINDNSQIKFVLCHWSSRYSSKELIDFFKEYTDTSRLITVL